MKKSFCFKSTAWSFSLNSQNNENKGCDEGRGNVLKWICSLWRFIWCYLGLNIVVNIWDNVSTTQLNIWQRTRDLMRKYYKLYITGLQFLKNFLVRSKSVTLGTSNTYVFIYCETLDYPYMLNVCWLSGHYEEILQTLLSKVTFIHSYTDGGGCQHIRSSSGFSTLPKDTLTCRQGELNRWPSSNRTLGLTLSHSCPVK